MEEFSDVLRKNPRFLFVGVAFFVILSFLAGYLGSYTRTVQLDLNDDSSPIFSTENSNYIFSVASTSGYSYFEITRDGKVGINTLDPKTELDVEGSIRVWGAFPPTCTKEIEGAIRYDGVTKHFIGCNGADWRTLDN